MELGDSSSVADTDGGEPYSPEFIPKSQNDISDPFDHSEAPLNF